MPEVQQTSQGSSSDEQVCPWDRLWSDNPAFGRRDSKDCDEEQPTRFFSWQEATSNKCIATRNKCLTTSNNKTLIRIATKFEKDVNEVN